MSQIGFVYKSSIGLSCVLLMLASVACTGWFFYSWLGGTPGIVGAAVGCAVQIMAYGFSGIVVHQANGLLRIALFLLIASALSLSVLSSYATLTGYLSALQENWQTKEQNAAKKDQALQAAMDQRLKLMESMSRDVAISSDAAGQGLSEKYRTQAGQFLSQNSATRSKIEAQIDELEAVAQSDLATQTVEKAASPIDGLTSVFGGQSTAIVILCAWLAIMFDALPIAGITLLETRPKKASVQRQDAGLSNSLPDPAALFVGALSHDQEPTHLLENDESSKEDFKILTNICSLDLPLTKAFFVQLLDFEVKYESDWYIQLRSPHHADSEFGVIQQDHELVPQQYQNAPNGMYLTFLVPDVDATYSRALELGIDIIQEPRDEFYGQRRFLAREPNGCLVDICSPS